MTTKSELHLIILWENARYKENEILNDIKENLSIRNIYEIFWTEDKVAENFTRFYGVNLPANSSKERECGTGGFLCVVVEDKNPQYDFLETSRGHEFVNTTLFTLKHKYRSWTKGGHKIHTTNSTKETDHDSALLLGLNYEDLLKTTPQQDIIERKQDLIGTNGWSSLEELFYTLNSTCGYLVLRNHEILPNEFATEEHGDIDILVSNYKDAEFILNTKKIFDLPYRVHCRNYVDNKEVKWDIRFLGDDYYCEEWEINFLKDRIKNSNNIYVMDCTNYFYTLIYHALIHKRKIALDYYEKIYNLFCELNLDKEYNIKEYASPFDLYFKLLNDFMNKNNYHYTKPIDSSVFYNERLTTIDKHTKYFEQNFKFSDIQTIYTGSIPLVRNVFLKAKNHEGKEIFIKYGDISGTYRNEYRNTLVAYNKNNKNFVKPLYYKDNSSQKFCVSELVKSKRLEEILGKETLSVELKQVFIKDLYNIFLTLKEIDIVHRDINPRNLIVTDEGLKLIDFQWSVCFSNYKEFRYFKERPKLLAGLGTANFALGNFRWDDSYSLLKVLECIGNHEAYSNEYEKIHQEIEKHIGVKIIKATISIWKHTKLVNTIAWWIPVKKWRQKFRAKFQ